MRKRYSIWLFLLTSNFCITSLYAQTPLITDTFRVMSYNVENLFDCKHDSLKNDHEFLPNSIRKWTHSRYKQKLLRISQTIAAVGENRLPDLIGLCEVENEKTMRDLTRYSPLKKAGYKYLITHSPDERGIDVALLYQPHRFQILHHEEIRIPSQRLNQRPTRNILHASGRLITGDTLHIFVCHFPSRSGGTKKSYPFRCLATNMLKQKVDSLFSIRTSTKILVMGDFNEYPNSPLFTEVLQTQLPSDSIPPQSTSLYNLMSRLSGGTYRYQGEWSIFDQILVSGTLFVKDNSLTVSPSLAHIANFPFLLEEDKRYGGKQPFRTYHGMKYKGGYSDHLPVYVDLLMFYGN